MRVARSEQNGCGVGREERKVEGRVEGGEGAVGVGVGVMDLPIQYYGGETRDG